MAFQVDFVMPQAAPEAFDLHVCPLYHRKRRKSGPPRKVLTRELGGGQLSGKYQRPQTC